jgi:type II secretory pathway component PulL
MIHKFSRDILGLDIRSDAVSAVLIKTGMKGLVIEASKHIRFSDTEEPSGNGLSRALATLASDMNIAGAFCIAALPFSRLSIRTLSVPFKDPKKIRQILPYELEPALPLPVENQVVDFLPLDQENTDQTTDLLIASVEQDELQFYLDQLASAGLDPEVVTINGHASASVLAERATGQGVMFADIGRKKVLVYVMASGKIQFVRSFPVSLETGKRVPSITTGLVHTFLACQERFPGQPLVGKIILSGRGDDEPEIQQNLEENLSLPVQSMDFIKETELSLMESQVSSWVPGEMDNALALCYCESRGLKGFNFRKGPFAQKKLWMDHKTDFIRSGILAGLVLFLLILSSFAETLILKSRLSALDHEIVGVFKATFPDRTVTVAPLEQMKSELQSKKNTPLFSEDTKTDIRTIDMLNEISVLIPNDLDVKITKLVYGAGSVLITGSTKTFNTVDDMKNRLETSSLFKGVTIASANLNREGDRVDFKLKIDLS